MMQTVMQRQMVTKTIEVDVTTYDRIETKAKQPVTTYEMAYSEKEVEVKKPQNVEKTGKRMVPVWIDVEKEIDVVTQKQVEKTGTRDVMVVKPVEKTVKQQVAKQVAYETTVKVPVYTPAPAPAPMPAPAPCATPCATSYSPCATSYGMSGGCGSSRGGLFRGGRGGCCR